MNSNTDLLSFFNEENYENFIKVDDLNSLIKEMVNYFDEHDMFKDEITIDEDDYTGENIETDSLDFIEIEKNLKKEHIKSLIEWDGAGEYCLAGYAWGYPSIQKTEKFLSNELFNFANEFPISLQLELFRNTEDYIRKWKAETGYKYVYFVTFICHQGIPWYQITHIVYSNNPISNLFETLYNEKDIFIGEFNSLGSNYFVQEAEEFDIDTFTSYKFGEFDIVTID